MKTTTTVKWAAALMLAAAMTVSAQGPGPGGQCPPGGPQGMGAGPQGGPGGGNFQPPSADEIVQHLLADFDANKDGKLDAAELKQSVEARQQNRMQQRGGPMAGPRGGQGGPQGVGPGPRGGQQGGFQGAPQGGPGGDRPERPAPENIAAKMFEDFDADKNGSLSPDELQKALAAHRPPPGGPRGFRGPQGGPQGGPGF